MDEIKKGVAEKKPAGGKSLPVGLIAIAVILAGVLIYMILAYQGQKKEMFEMETMLTSEKDSLANELRLMIHGYDTLKSNNDTLNAQLVKEQERIRQLLSINANNVQLIRTYRSEIGTMRNIMKSYIVQIDSLNTRNKILVAENEQIRGEISQVTRTNVELSKVREDLTAKVEIASVVQAKDIIVLGLNQKRKDTDRIDRMSTLSVCFTLRENPIAAAGRKTVYMRIIRPDGLVITDSPENTFQHKGERIVFSASREVDYENVDLEVCIYQPKSADFVPGTSTIELYLEGNLIGTATFALRK